MKYKPKLTVPSRSPKEIEDLDFDVEMNVKRIDSEYANAEALLMAHEKQPQFIEPNLEPYTITSEPKKRKPLVRGAKKGRPRKNRYYN